MSDRNTVTYFPPATQALYRTNREQVRGKPYEKYFSGDLWIHGSAMAALAAPLAIEDAVSADPVGLDSLLEAGPLRVPNGYCEMPDGSGYVASTVPFPGCSGEMLSWWFWWHAVEPARYTLWYPYNHISARPTRPEVLTAPGLSHEERFIGTTHIVDEYVGPDLVRIAIKFVKPEALGFSADRLARCGVVAHACARVQLRRPHLEVVTMVHLAVRTDDGFELRSRYWFGHQPRVVLGQASIPVSKVADVFGVRRRMGAGRLAYEQYLHDQIEFTHLSTFLADIYHEFGEQSAPEGSTTT